VASPEGRDGAHSQDAKHLYAIYLVKQEKQPYKNKIDINV